MTLALAKHGRCKLTPNTVMLRRLKTYVGNAIDTASRGPAWLASKAVPVAADGAGLFRNAAADAADRVALFRRRYVCTCLNAGPAPLHLCPVACKSSWMVHIGLQVEHCRLGVHLTRMCPCSKHYDELEEELDDDMKRRTMHLSSADVTPDHSASAEKQHQASGGQVKMFCLA